MSNPSRFSRRILLAVPLLLLAGAAAAQARMLDAPRAAGTVGERFDGFAVARDASAAALVEQVNAERRKVYADRARSDGVPPDQVGRVYAQEIFKSAPAGTWLQQESGQWMQK